MKVHVVKDEDDDFKDHAVALARTKLVESTTEAADTNAIVFDLDETIGALQSLTGDNRLSDMVTADNSFGYPIWKDATSLFGVSLNTLVAFATEELRILQLKEFMAENYPKHVFRERQDTKVRYEVSSEGVRISSIFATVEANKAELRLSDYGVSQTSLEQVFNLHAAEAERLKQGHVDR